MLVLKDGKTLFSFICCGCCWGVVSSPISPRHELQQFLFAGVGGAIVHSSSYSSKDVSLSPFSDIFFWQGSAAGMTVSCDWEHPKQSALLFILLINSTANAPVPSLGVFYRSPPPLFSSFPGDLLDFVLRR